uniref:Uncharacterized protein n=1 Tax=Rhizophora mucronata TaxID=61149 RepID=A0A2P2P851_RHIMU
MLQSYPPLFASPSCFDFFLFNLVMPRLCHLSCHHNSARYHIACPMSVQVYTSAYTYLLFYFISFCPFLVISFLFPSCRLLWI